MHNDDICFHSKNGKLKIFGRLEHFPISIVNIRVIIKGDNSVHMNIFGLNLMSSGREKNGTLQIYIYVYTFICLK